MDGPGLKSIQTLASRASHPSTNRRISPMVRGVNPAMPRRLNSRHRLLLDKGPNFPVSDQVRGTDLMDDWGRCARFGRRITECRPGQNHFAREDIIPILLISDSTAVIEGFAAQLCLSDVASRRHALREPYIAANGRAAADGDPAKDRSAGIDHDVVFDDGMPGIVFDQGAVLIHFKPLGPQRHRLVQPHVPADDRCLADDDACPVIDEKALADFRPGMDVYSGFGMRDLRDDAREHGGTQKIKFVGEPVADDRGDPRITKHHLVEALGRGIPFEGIVLYRMQDGLIVATWLHINELMLLSQIGAIPALAA